MTLKDEFDKECYLLKQMVYHSDMHDDEKFVIMKRIKTLRNKISKANLEKLKELYKAF